MEKYERRLCLGAMLVFAVWTNLNEPNSVRRTQMETIETMDLHFVNSAGLQQESEPATEPQDEPVKKTETEAERNERLAKYLTGTKWTGKFTMTGQDDQPAAEEKYEIIEATKAEKGDDWNLVARIQYGGKDVTLPLPTLEIKWAGETPVITVDKMVIPGMGTFDARVLIRKGQYAGTWAHGKVGGHMFGNIEKIEAKAK